MTIFHRHLPRTAKEKLTYPELPPKWKIVAYRGRIECRRMYFGLFFHNGCWDYHRYETISMGRSDVVASYNSEMKKMAAWAWKEHQSELNKKQFINDFVNKPKMADDIASVIEARANLEQTFRRFSR